MKKTLLIILPLLLIVGCSKPVDFETITVRNNLAYLSQETKPYTGSVYKNSGEKEILKGTYKDGFKVGTWTYKTLTGSGIYDVYYNIGKVDSILFYESDSTGPLNNRIFFVQDADVFVVGRWMAFFFENRYTKSVLKAIGTTTNIGFLSLIDMDSLKMKDGGFFYQNTNEYNFFKYPEVYAQIKNNMLNGDYYNWEDQELKVLGTYENNKKTGLWENRSYLIDETNSFSVLILVYIFSSEQNYLLQKKMRTPLLHLRILE